jgi:solute carrier family 35 protein F5
VLTSLLLLPVVGALHATGVEDLSGLLSKPHLATIVALVLLKGLFDNVLSDLLWARAIQLTSPTLASVGLSLTIPMAVVSDLAVRGLVPRAQGAAGAACIFVGFLCSVLGERRQLAKA